MATPLSQLGALTSALGTTVAAVEGLKVVFSAVGEKLADSLKDITKVDQRLSVINSDLRSSITGNIDALEDTTGGLTQAAKALTELRVLGFEKNNKNLVDLATRLKLSGQDTAALFQLSQSLLSLGGLTEGSIDGLAKQVIDLSKTFGVTADSLVGAIDQLTSNLLDLNVLGGAEAAASFTANLAANVGQENAKLAGSFARTLTSVSTNQNQLAIVGLEGLANQIATGATKGFGNQRDLIINAGEQVKSILGVQGNITLRQLQALRPIVGDVGVQAVRLAEELKKGSPRETFGDRISELVSVIKENLLAPFNAAIVNLQPSFEYLIGGLSIVGTSLLNFVAAFTPVISLVFRVVGLIASLIGTIVNAISSVVDSVFSLFGAEQGGFDKVFQTLTAIQQASSDSANSLQQIGTAEKQKRTKDLLNVKVAESELSYLSARRLQGIDFLLRSAELNPLSELLQSEANDYLRELVGYGKKGVRERIKVRKDY